ncbi:anti-sigma factor family protein [Sphingobium ummariense]
MSMIDEAMLIAWVDGELDEVNRRRVERALADDPALAERAETHRRLRARLTDHFAPVGEEPVPDRFRTLLAESAAMVSMERPGRSRWRGWATGGAIAASLLLGLGLGRVSGGDGEPVGVRDGVMVAKGQLASVLDDQLAAAQDGAAVRIGLSFRRKGGGWCRSFEGEALAGVACREEQGWQVQQLVPGTGPETAYRQASSGDARVMATVDALREGPPADAAQEVAAREAGWR